MKYFTVEIEGKPIAAFRCEDREDAEGILEAADFHEDLMVLAGPGGKPLWDGNSSLHLRKAAQNEVEKVEAAWEQDEDRLKNIDDEYIVFLVPVSDPTDDDVEDA